MLADPEEDTPLFWVFAVLSAILLYAGERLSAEPGAGIGPYTARFGACAAASLFLILLSLIGGSAGGLRRTSPIAVLYAPAAAACFGTFLLCIHSASAAGFPYVPQSLAAALLPVSALFGFLFSRDRASVLYPPGLLLFTAGLYALYFWRTGA